MEKKTPLTTHSKVRGINPTTGKPYLTDAAIAAKKADLQNLHENLAKKPEYTVENTRPEPTLPNPNHKRVDFNPNCAILGGKKSRKSHNSKKQRKSKKSHTTIRSKRSRR
jgi:hypothetical protein